VLISRQRERAENVSAEQAELAQALLKVENATMAARTAQAELALTLFKAKYAKLVAAARASVTAARAGAADPLVYVRAELSRYDGLPPLDSTVPTVLADANTAMTLAGRAAGPASWRRPGDLDEPAQLCSGVGRGKERPYRSIRIETEAQRPFAQPRGHGVLVLAELLQQFLGEVLLVADPGLGGYGQQVGGRPGGTPESVGPVAFHAGQVGQHVPQLLACLCRTRPGTGDAEAVADGEQRGVQFRDV
jgi:hypothetical protein